MIKNEDENILVIYERAHTYLLNQFLNEHGIYQIENVCNYLKAKI